MVVVGDFITVGHVRHTVWPEGSNYHGHRLKLLFIYLFILILIFCISKQFSHCQRWATGVAFSLCQQRRAVTICPLHEVTMTQAACLTIWVTGGVTNTRFCEA